MEARKLILMKFVSGNETDISALCELTEDLWVGVSVDSMDSDRNEKVSFKELVLWLAVYLKGTEEKKLKRKCDHSPNCGLCTHTHLSLFVSLFKQTCLKHLMQMAMGYWTSQRS